MAGTTLDLEYIVSPDMLATEIARNWDTWHSLRREWLEEKKVLRNYLYATDTSTTQNSSLPWKNNTTTPKLTQIYDNLKANYTAALFPNGEWMKWEASGGSSTAEAIESQAQAKIIQGYLQSKLRQSQFEVTADSLIDDFILYGNCFASVDFERNYHKTEAGETIAGYVGPRLVRISPNDIVFNPVSTTFKKSPKIVRSVVTLGELRRGVDNGDYAVGADVFDKVLRNRREVGSSTSIEKTDGFIADGFSSIENYYGSGYVELLTFYGDIYDTTEDKLKQRRIITVVDRAYVLDDKEMPSWFGEDPFFHSGWRERPDNLYAMGPLDNLVGLQYRIDHLENLRADVFDQIAFPILKVRGDVEDFTHQPGERIYLGEEGDVTPMVPDATALNADFQISTLEARMEELAGAPKQAMGIRTPGEKTAFEVQSLQNASGRIFQHKAEKFEREFIEPILNAMLETSRREMQEAEVVRTIDNDLGSAVFMQITREDIVANGAVVPVGARHFAERARRLQDLQVIQQAMANPSVGIHLSGKKLAEIIATELGEPDLYSENVGVDEQIETQEAAQEAQVSAEERQEVALENGL